MSTNISRRGDQGLGRTAAGGNTGSFAGHERATAVPPPASVPVINRDAIKRAMRDSHLIQMALEVRRADLTRLELAGVVLKAAPEASKIRLWAQDDDDGYDWGFAQALDSRGVPLNVPPAARDELNRIARQSGEGPVTMLDEDEDGKHQYIGEFDVSEAIESGELALGRTFLDSDTANPDDLGDFLDASGTRLGFSGIWRSREDFEGFVRRRANEDDPEFVDAMVEKAMELYDSDYFSGVEDQHFTDVAERAFDWARAERAGQGAAKTMLMTHPSDGHGPDDTCIDCAFPRS